MQLLPVWEETPGITLSSSKLMNRPGLKVEILLERGRGGVSAEPTTASRLYATMADENKTAKRMRRQAPHWTRLRLRTSYFNVLHTPSVEVS